MKTVVPSGCIKPYEPEFGLFGVLKNQYLYIFTHPSLDACELQRSE
jgi:hypothetical protein